MDPKSGIFTAIVPGCYLFCLTLCSQDMKKVLVALRKNGEEVTTLLKRDKSNHYSGWDNLRPEPQRQPPEQHGKPESSS